MKSNSHFEQFNATLKIFNMGLGYVVNRDTSETFYVKRNNYYAATFLSDLFTPKSAFEYAAVIKKL